MYQEIQEVPAVGIKFPHRFRVEIDWPQEINHNNRWYIRTSKLGTNYKTRLPAAEYAWKGKSELRLWLLSNGDIIDD